MSGTHQRHSVRLAGANYSAPGFYFITICTKNRECLFGDIVAGKMRLNEYGKIVQKEWNQTPIIRPEIVMDEFVIMPNHIHGIILITDKNGGQSAVGANGRSPLQHGERPFRMKPRSVSSFVSGYKSIITTRINQMRGTPRAPIWQRNYYEHIIRGNAALNRIRQYIRDNPKNWGKDANNPVAVIDPRQKNSSLL